MPFKYQILITPATMIIMLSGLVWFTLDYYGELRAENETVRQWGKKLDRLHIAIGASQRMQSVINKMSTTSSAQDEDLLFIYIEQYQILSDRLNCPGCFENTSTKSQTYIKQSLKSLMPKERLDVPSVVRLLEEFLPHLETTYQLIWAKKREAYNKVL